MSDGGLVIQRKAAGRWRFSIKLPRTGSVTGEVQFDVPQGTSHEDEKALARDEIRKLGTAIANAQIIN